MKKKEQIKKWIETWEGANSSLTLIRIKELKDKNYYRKNRATLNSMLQYAFDHRTIKKDSGLVTLQKYLKLYSQRMTSAK